MKTLALHLEELLAVLVAATGSLEIEEPDKEVQLGPPKIVPDVISLVEAIGGTSSKMTFADLFEVDCEVAIQIKKSD